MQNKSIKTKVFRLHCVQLKEQINSFEKNIKKKKKNVAVFYRFTSCFLLWKMMMKKVTDR